MTAEILQPQGDGVLVAQGGKLHGYALYVKDGKLCFDLRRDGTLVTATATDPLPESKTTVRVVLSRHGQLQLLVDDKPAIEPAQVGVLTRTPADGLSAALDAGDPVGDYAAPFTYKGELGEVIVEASAQ